MEYLTVKRETVETYRRSRMRSTESQLLFLCFRSLHDQTFIYPDISSKMSFKDFCNLIHSKLLITTEDESFEGILKFVGLAAQRVTFEHVFEVPSRNYLGTMHILFSSISSWRLIEPCAEGFQKSDFDTSEDLVLREFDKKSRIDQTNLLVIGEGKSIFEYLPPHLKSSCPSDYCIIDFISPVFDRAIENLLNCAFIGVFFDGPKVSRSGILTWVCISTSTCVFLFDIQKLGVEAFEKGLKRIFENENIVKVIHDCRNAADCLINIYNTELKNVFDTQVADYLINMQMYTGESSFKYVNSLDSCLFKYLEIPQQLLLNRNRCASFNDEKEFYGKRPVAGDFINILIKNSMYLTLLKERQEKQLMLPFENTVESYSKSIISSPDSVVRIMLPSKFQHLFPLYLRHCVKSVRFSNLPSTTLLEQFKNIHLEHKQKVCDQPWSDSSSSEMGGPSD